jgi:hypothetical protein
MAGPPCVVVFIQETERRRDIAMPEGIVRSFDGALHLRPGATETLTPDELRVLKGGKVAFRVVSDPNGLLKPPKKPDLAAPEPAPKPPEKAKAAPKDPLKLEDPPKS